ncbi:hypothetical protein J4216_02445 [Candidatus Woesearchaeota archaeon]|nr:hypothetical protein [Candidatus Woesearchaeota archaeon]
MPNALKDIRDSLDVRISNVLDETLKIIREANLPPVLANRYMDLLKESYDIGLEISGKEGRIARYPTNKFYSELQNLRDKYTI